MQWLIDIILEKVADAGYALQSWVSANFFTQTQILESTIPLIVTGDLTPDATGTYFAAGLYQGRLYYRRTDGAYFIWWDGPCLDYNLSTGLGVKAPGFWWGPWKNIEGEYGWADDYDGLPFVAEGYSYLTTGFVNRGDPAPFDFSLVDLVADGAWHELDLSSIVPYGVKGVALSVVLLNTMVNKLLQIRLLGNVNDANVSAFNTQTANILITGDLTFAVDGNRKAEYKLTAGGWFFVFFTVKAWWF